METDTLRPDLYVVVRILEALWRNANRMRSTHLQLASGINYSRFERYIAYLESRGLVVHQGGGSAETYIDLTPAGHDALRFLARGMQEILGMPLDRMDPGLLGRHSRERRSRTKDLRRDPVDPPAGSED